MEKFIYVINSYGMTDLAKSFPFFPFNNDFFLFFSLEEKEQKRKKKIQKFLETKKKKLVN